MSGKSDCNCLNEEQMIELYYAESTCADFKEHLRDCKVCQDAFSILCSELVNIDLPVPDGGQRAVSEALNLLNRKQKPILITGRRAV